MWGQEAANAGMVELQRQFEQARRELAGRETTSSTKVLVDHCAALEKELQVKDRQLQEACAAYGDPLLRTQLANIGREHDEAKKRVQELLTEGLTLEAHHKELQQQAATTTAELEAKLRVAHLEIEGCQNSEFAQSQKSEVG